MASVETRDVVKRHELQHNPLLVALRPGGTLAGVEVTSPCEALLVPRQVSLEAAHILPYLQAKPQRRETASPLSPAPPLSALFGEGHDTPEREKPSRAASANTAAGSSGNGAKKAFEASPSGVYYAPENEAAFRAALTTFLEYHLLHFDRFANSEFTTLRGQRGAFSEDLDHVKRFGYLGQVAVLADADPLLQASSTGSGAAPSSSPSAGAKQGDATTATYRPTALQIFFIDRPLMDSSELRSILDTLRRLTVGDASHAKVAERLNALFDEAPTTTPPPKSADIPYLMGTKSISERATAKTDGGPARAAFALATPVAVSPANAAASPHQQQQQQRRSVFLRDTHSDNESVAETIVIDDFYDEGGDDPDLAPYLSKYTQISERQRLHSDSHRASGGSAVVRGRAVSTEGHCAATPPVPGALDPHEGRTAAVVGHVTAQIVVAPSATPSPSSKPVTASRADAAQGNTAGGGGGLSRGRVVAATVATAPPAKPAAPPAGAAKVLRHEYSRECIKDYRRVVAADNEIYYNVFEHLMALRCSAPLATSMSSYVSKNQQLQQPILNNVKYNAFVSSCHALIQQVPRFAQDRRQQTILFEGIERYVTTRLYRQLYNVCEDEKRQNAMLQEKFALLESMAAEELEALPEVERHHVWGQAMFELDGMDFFKSPREKLRCGMRACELLSLAVGDILRQRRRAKNAAGNGSGPASPPHGSVPLAFGADEFLPCFLLLVLRARPLNYVQNICYIEKFRFSSLLSPEESYCFATLQSALMFWLNCREDGRLGGAVATDGGTAAAQSTATPTGASANMKTLSTAASAGAVPPRPTQTAPLMTEKDLLPSVRQASYTARAQTTTAGGAAAAAVGGGNLSANGTAQSESAAGNAGEAPTVLDVLFGWANRTIAPLVSDAGANGSSGRGPAAGGSRDDAAATGGLPTPPPTAALSKEAPATEDLFNPVAQSPPPVRKPDANTRALVRELLVTQRKTFEQLTLTEIQMIVEEARQMVTEKSTM